MSDKILDSKVVLQVAILVKDIKTTAAKYAELFGVDVPEICISAGYDKALTEYKGKHCDVTCKMAFIYLDNLTIEIIEPDGKESIWTDMLNENGEGFHHMAFGVKGMKEAICTFEKTGMPLIQKGEYQGGRYAFIDSVKDYKMVFELLENDNK